MSAAPGRVVCTLGMHRSGTSLVSRLLNLLGVHLGPEERISSTGADNLKGYWEHRSFVEINDALLARFGGRWDEPPALPPGWERDPRVADLAGEARRVVAADFAAAPLWGWKDPRTCLTLPFWQDVVGPMRYVICVRNPRAVIDSLTRRNGMELERAERLWLSHLQASLAHTAGQPRMFVFYEDVLADWRTELRRMAEFVGAPERGEDALVQEAARQFVDGEMCHHLGSDEQLAQDREVALATIGLYLALKGPASDPMLDLLAARALETWDRTAALSAERDGLVRTQQEQDAALAALTALQAATTAENERLARQNREQAAAVSSLGAALDEIHASRAWKLALFSRRLAGGLFPPGSGRRRAVSALLGQRARPPAPASTCFCTLAIHAPYRRRARLLCGDAASAPWVVLTDEPADFADLPVRAIRHSPTGPMAADYLDRLPLTGNGRGAAAYHDKRFALQAALRDYDTAIFVDADSRMGPLPPLPSFPPGLSVLPVVRKSVAEHLETCGPWRLPAFTELARRLTGDAGILRSAPWCHETCIAVTRDGNEDLFFEAWGRGAAVLQELGVYSGEGGVIGLAAACAGWTADYDALTAIAPAIEHEGGGPKGE